MHVRSLFAVYGMTLALALAAGAQTTPDAGTPPSATAPSKAPSKAASKKKSKTSKKGRKATPPPAAPKSNVDEETRKALEAASPTPTAPAATTPAPNPAREPPPQPPPEQTAQGPQDDEPPVLQHTPVTAAKKGRSLTITARATDASGVFGPVLYLRKKGMPAADYIPMRMSAVKSGAGDYALEIPAALVSVDALEYYVEVWDNAGNGPVRAGSAEAPLAIKVEEEKKIIARPTEPTAPTNVTIKAKGAPPAITHSAVASSNKGQPIEINARLVGDTGVSGATVMFRHVGEKAYKALPMGNIGGDDYTATIPAGMATSDIEYYLEAFDKNGNGPGRNGAPNVPYVIKVGEPKPPSQQLATGGFGAPGQPGRPLKAPFRPNFGRSAAWLAMAGFAGGLVFAGGEAYAAWSQHNAYTHTFNYEGRNDLALLSRANTSGSRAKTAAIVSGASLITAVVLFVVFPEHADAVGSGGDLGVRF